MRVDDTARGGGVMRVNPRALVDALLDPFGKSSLSCRTWQTYEMLLGSHRAQGRRIRGSPATKKIARVPSCQAVQERGFP